MVMLTDTELGELARMLQHHTPMCLLSDMQVRAALELMQQRGWTITRQPHAVPSAAPVVR
ncbi:hypothetical protein ACVIIV_005080 [Bradyrhizobium sp. USDA 4354]